MKPDISEFSYGYALTEELTEDYELIGAPEFPSLYLEGQEGGGYDLKLPRRGMPIFIQFKRSYPMVRRSAREFKDGLLDIPFYRMHLRALKHSIQHNLLLRHEQNGNEVYYATPMFHTSIELNRLYLDKTVLRHSILISPNDIGPLPDEESHHIAFRPNSMTGYLCSEPEAIELRPSVDIINQILREIVSSERARIIDSEFFISLGDELLDNYDSSPHLETYNYLLEFEDLPIRPVFRDRSNREIEIFTEFQNLRNLRRLRDQVQPHQYVHYISRNLYECELLLVVD